MSVSSRPREPGRGMAAEFLFGLPNSIGSLSSRRLIACGVVLTLCGLVSVISAAVASAQEAVKTYHLQEYTNTHWITTVFLFAGIATILLDLYKVNFYLYLTLVFVLVSCPIAFGAFLADCINLNILSKLNESYVNPRNQWMYLKPRQVHAMKAYAGVDLVVSLTALATAVVILREIGQFSSRFFARVEEYRSRPLFFAGLCLTVLTSVKAVFWMVELVWLKNLGVKAQFMFLHYTVDEPVWNLIFVGTGLLTMIVAARGTRILMYSSLGLTALSAQPALLYLWIDYRWYSNVKLTDITVHLPKPANLLEWNLGFGVLHLLLILGIVIVQIVMLARSGNFLYQIQLTTEPSLRKAVGFIGVLFICAGLAFLVSDIANLLAKSFYRIFYPTEQKAPFLLVATGLLCMLALRRVLAVYFIPITFCLLLMTFHNTIFHIAAYIFLSHQQYYGDRLCSLFAWGQKTCTYSIDRLGTVSHFFEAAMASSILMLSLYGAVVFGRLMHLHHIHLGHLDLGEQLKKRRLELWVTVAGTLQLIGGIIVLGSSLLEFGTDFDSLQRRHPLIILHSFVYRTCLSLALIIYPLVQLIFAKHLLFYPLRSLTICAFSMIRFVEIITQMDYRNLGQNYSFAWTIFSGVEVISSALHFLTLCLCAGLIDMSLNRLPKFDFTDPAAPTGNTYADLPENGTAGAYVGLRATEDGENRPTTDAWSDKVPEETHHYESVA